MLIQNIISNIRYNADLMTELIIRDFKLRYNRSILGVAWSLITPLLQLQVFYFVFDLVLVLNIKNYPLFVIIGMLPWIWFQAALFQASNCITNSKELINQPGFISEIMPIVAVMCNFINFLLTFPFLFIFLMFSDVSIKSVIFLTPLIILVQFIFTLSLSYLIAAVNVIFRDSEQILIVLTQLWFFLSPIVYEAKIIPPKYADIYLLNPLVHILNSYRAVIMEGEPPNFYTLGIILVFSIVLLFLGIKLFRNMRFQFVEEL
jgi:lipopolysaccharide transport system permease protein